MITPLRVLQVVRPAMGGIRAHVRSLLDGLPPARVLNSVAAPPSFVRSLLHQPNLHATITLDIAARLSPMRDFVAAARLARLVPKFADLVHAHGLRAAWIVALAHRKQSFPFVFTAHNQVGLDLGMRLVVPYIAAHADRVIAVSQAVADSLALCGMPRAKMTVIPNGLDLSRFDPALFDRAEARQSFGIPDNAFVIAGIGRLSREKGMDTLLLAAAQRAMMTFLIAGDGPLRAALARQASPNVKLLGRLEDVRPLLAASDVLAVPSRSEGQGIAALEAMAMGVPVAASWVGGLAEMLTDGETGLLFPPEDPDALAAAVSRLRSDHRLRQKLVSNALPLVSENYDVRHMLEAVMEVYESFPAFQGRATQV